MKAIKLNFLGKVSIAWGEVAVGINAATQRAVATAFTQPSSSSFAPEMGGALVEDVFSSAANDSTRLQHTLNFVAIRTIKQVRDDTAAPEDRLTSLRLRLVDIGPDRVARVLFETENAAGQKSSTIV